MSRRHPFAESLENRRLPQRVRRRYTADMMWTSAVALGLVAAYWTGATATAVALRLRTGQSSNPWPKSRWERLLIAIWIADIAVWLAVPILRLAEVRHPTLDPLMEPLVELPALAVAGTALAAVGVAFSGLAWFQMGDSWRLGTNRKERTELVTTGVFGWVRHPIYASQAWLLVGTVLLLPTPAYAVMAAVHLACLAAKAAHEETFLRELHGEPYSRYCEQVGGFWPRLWSARPAQPPDSLPRDSLPQDPQPPS